ncbi:MAG: HEAT repeat domain-containing protein [Chloroflexi bacterium]|nr:MAG: HEAT repeat domain-containing protein [Chloroflexota bacterium]
MTQSRSSVGVIHQATAGIRRGALRRQLQAVAAGKRATVSIDLEQPGVDVGEAIEEITNRLPMESMPVQRLVFAFKRSGTADRVVERLAAKSPQQRARSARVVGALQLTEAVPWVAALLESRDRAVLDAAARALGKIAGARSATALVLAIQRRGLSRRLVAELARAAPDLFVEVALTEPQRPAVRPALAIAAGLRRRQTAVAPLIGLLEHGSRRERVIACRALGWIGSGTAVPIIKGALVDRDWKIRMSAAKALGALHAQDAKDDLKYLQIDRNARVRKAATQALYRLKPR